MKSALIAAVIFAGLLVAWLVFGRQLVLLVDAFATSGDAAPTNGPFVASPGWLNVGDTPLELSRSGQPAELRIDADAVGRLSLHVGEKVFALGARTVSSHTPGPFDIPFAPDPGDTVSFRIAHRVFGWPTPFDFNFITGKSPSWRRNVYYMLNWRNGMARYEQWFYDDWGSPQMTNNGATGLIHARIDGG